MDVTIHPSVGYTELGQRSNNEDALFPADPRNVPIGQRWFLVCDGVGGAEKGEVASELAVTSFDAFFRQNPVRVATEAYIQQGVAYTETRFNQFLAENPQTTGMATTVTLLFLHQEGATVAHIGDSRVYFIRDGRIIWRTEDHSYVNELVRSGVLSPAEASRHPQRNIITRAMQGGDKAVQASVQVINDLRAGDYFFLCSDGVLERIGEELLENTLAGTGSNGEKMNTLRQLSIDGGTKDNFTAYLIQIDQVAGNVDAENRAYLPAYERPEPEDDGGITVMGAEGSTSSPATDQNRQPEPMAGPSVTELPLTLVPVDEQSQPAASSVAPVLSTRSSSMGPLMLWLATGILLGVGGYFAWSAFAHSRPAAVSSQTSVTRTQPAAKPATTVRPISTATGVVNASNSLPNATSKEATAETLQSDNRTEAAGEKSRIAIRGKSAGGIYVGLSADGQYGLTKDKKSWWVEPDFKHIELVSSHHFQCERLDGSKQYITIHSQQRLDEIGPLRCDHRLVRKGDQYSYLNKEFRLSAKFRYSKAEDFNESNDCKANVVENGQSKTIDLTLFGDRAPK